MLRTVRSALYRIVVVTLSLVLLTPTSAALAALGSPGGRERLHRGSASQSKNALEVTGARTANAKHYALADGTYQADVFSEPVHFRDETGEFQDVVASLAPAPTPGSHAVVAAAVETEFGSEGMSRTPVRLSTADWSIGIDMSNARERTKIALGSEVRYLGVAPETSLVYAPSGNGVKETLVLASPAAPSRFQFSLDLDGLTVRNAPGHGHLLYTHEGQCVGELGELVVFDSREQGELDPCESATMTVESCARGAQVTYEVSREWLDDPSRVFPVMVDPTITSYDVSSRPCPDTFICQGKPTSSFGSYRYLSTGHGANGMTWSFAKFDLSALPQDAFVYDARFKALQYRGARNSVRFGVCTKPWSDSTTWRTRPSFQYLGTQTPRASSAWITQGCTGIVQEWVSGERPNHGFAIYEPWGSTGNHREFRSGEYPYTRYRPRVEVRYDRPSENLAVSTEKQEYGIGETVTVTATYASPETTDAVERFEVGANAGCDDPARLAGTFGWFVSDPSAEDPLWECRQLDDGSYVAFHHGQGAEKVTQLLDSAEHVGTDLGHTLTFAFRIEDEWGGLQAASLDARAVLGGSGGRFETGWVPGGSSFSVRPRPVQDVSVETTAGEWRSISRSPGGVVEPGRGAIHLDWGDAAGAAGYKILLSDGQQMREVASTTATSWSSAEAGIYPRESAISGQIASGDPYCDGDGTELRDDPSGLYAAVLGDSEVYRPYYQMKVVPFAEGGISAHPADCPTLTAAIDKRTLQVHEDPRHTAHGLGQMADHTGAALLDTGSFELSITDIPVLSYGPDVSLVRTYRSDSTETASFALGWSFGFDRRIEAGGELAVYVDEFGDRRAYARQGDDSWSAPNGCFDTLSAEGDLLDGGGWRLETVDRDVLGFDGGGRLIYAEDCNGNRATYEWHEGALLVTAANGQEIRISMSDGRVTQAQYVTQDGVRIVTYELLGDLSRVTRYVDTESEHEIAYLYDANRLTGIAVPAVGASWEVAYDAAGDLAFVRNAAIDSAPAMRRDIERDSESRCATVTTFDGATRYEWNPTGTTAAASEVGSATLVTKYAYSPHDLVVSERKPGGETSAVTHDRSGRPIEESRNRAVMRTMNYDEDGNCIEERDARGSLTERTFDAYGNATVVEKSLNTRGDDARSEFTYGFGSRNRGRLISERHKIDDGEWARTDYVAHDQVSGVPQCTRVCDVLLSGGADPVDIETFRNHDFFGNEILETDAGGLHATRTIFDMAGRAVRSEDASSAVNHSRYDAVGNCLETWRSHESTEARIDWRVSTYDAAGNLALEIARDANGNEVSSVRHAYDPLGREVVTDDSALPGSAKTAYDEQGRATSIQDEGASGSPLSTARFEYRLADGVSVLREPGASEAAIETHYSAAGLVLSRTETDGSSIEYTYDSDDLVALETRPTEGDPSTTHYAYDIAGRLVVEVEPDDTSVTYDYDLLGRQTSARIEGQSVSQTERNTLGWVLRQSDHDGVTTEYEYDRCGRVIRERSQVGEARMTFDGRGLETLRADSDGSSIDREHDVFGREVSETHIGTDGACSMALTREYDDANRISWEHDHATGQHLCYEYRADGAVLEGDVGPVRQSTVVRDGTGLQRSLVATVAGERIDWSVVATDSAGRVTSWSSVALGGSFRTVYDEAGRVCLDDFVSPGWSAEDVSDGGVIRIASLSSGTARQVASPYTYSEITGKKIGESPRFRFTGEAENTSYQYDPTGRVISATRDGSTTAYTYDDVTGALSMISSEATEPVDITYDDRGRVTTRGETTYSHDSSGRRTRSDSGRAEGSFSYDWAGQRLSGVTADDAEVTHAYDGRGQRVRTTHEQGSVTTTTTWSYDGLELDGLLAVRSDGSSWTVQYLRDERGTVFGGAYRSDDCSPTPFLAVTTERGDIRELLDATGQAFAFYAYDVYGNPQSIQSRSTSTISSEQAEAIARRQVLRYASYAWDADTGLYYCSQRYLDPSVAAFISRDPARDDGEESAYQYCSGDPVNNVDPTGQWKQWSHHYSWTYRWARAYMRWSTFWSRQVALGSAELDNPSTSAVLRPDLHFNLWDMRGTSPWRTTYGPGRRDSRMSYMWYTLKTASSYWKKGWRVSGMRMLGRGIHAVQDTYAHGNAHPLVHLADTGRGAMWKRINSKLPWFLRKRRVRYSHFDNPSFKQWRVLGTRNITIWVMRGFRGRTGF